MFTQKSKGLTNLEISRSCFTLQLKSKGLTYLATSYSCFPLQLKIRTFSAHGHSALTFEEIEILRVFCFVYFLNTRYE